MAPAYQNVSSGQVVVSDEPRPDLEELARWDEIPEPEPTSTPPAAPTTPLASTVAPPADPAATQSGDPATAVTDPPPADPSAAAPVAADGGPVAPLADPAPVPDETWTHEQLDALAEKRDIKFPANTNKAAKVAALTAPAGE